METKPTPSATTAPSTPLSDSMKKMFLAPTIVAVVMIFLSLVGVGLTDYQREYARSYWLAMVPVFGIMSVWLAWRKEMTGSAFAGLAMRQALHWAGVFIIFLLLFSYLRKGQISVEAAGFAAVLLIALSSYLAGVHFDPHFFLVAVLQLGIAWMILQVQATMWIALPLGGLVILLLIVGLMIRLRRAGS